MTKKRAREIARACVRALNDDGVRNLYEHSANRTPVVLGKRVYDTWFDERRGAG